MKAEGTPRTPAEKTLAAAAYAVYAERYTAGGDPEAAWRRVTAVTDAKIVPYYVQHIATKESSNA